MASPAVARFVVGDDDVGDDGRFPFSWSPESTLETAKVAFADHDYDQFCDFNLNGSKQDQQEQTQKLVEPIKDRSAFIVDMIAVIRKYSDKPDARLFESDAKLVGLKIDGQVATAKLVQTRDGKEESAPITFAKNGSSWKIDEFQFN